jgi:DNA-binding transcriptional MocR family regulator
LGVFHPVQGDKRSLEGHDVSYIPDLVEQGVLTPGERLPPGRELAAQLRLSRTALREALQTLAALDLVVARHGRGLCGWEALQATAQRHCYTMRSLVLLEALSLPDLPEGFAPLCELVMQRDLRDHQRVAALCEAAWQGISAGAIAHDIPLIATRAIPW